MSIEAKYNRSRFKLEVAEIDVPGTSKHAGGTRATVLCSRSGHVGHPRKPVGWQWLGSTINYHFRMVNIAPIEIYKHGDFGDGPNGSLLGLPH